MWRPIRTFSSGHVPQSTCCRASRMASAQSTAELDLSKAAAKESPADRENKPVVLGDGLGKDLIVDLQRRRHGIRVLCPQPGRADQVGKEEGDGPRRHPGNRYFHWNNVGHPVIQRRWTRLRTSRVAVPAERAWLPPTTNDPTHTTLARPEGNSSQRAEDGIRTRDSHLGKVVIFISMFSPTPLSCCTVQPVSTSSTHSVAASRAVY